MYNLWGPGQKENTGPLVPKWKEFQVGDSGAFNQTWDTCKADVLYSCIGDMSMKLIYEELYLVGAPGSQSRKNAGVAREV